MINVQLIRFAELRAKIQALPEAVRQRTAMEMDRIVVYITRLVKANKLSGDPLHVRTGLLRNSIHGVVEGHGTDNVVGVVGTAVKYAHIHEYGFQGTVEVPAYVRMMGFNKRGARIAIT